MSDAVDGVDDDALVPDDDTMHRFLLWWFGAPGSRGCNKGRIEIGWIDVATGKLNQFKPFELDEVWPAALHAAKVNGNPGCNVYFRPATVAGLEHQFTKDGDVVQIPGCWLDCDDADAVERVLQGPGPAPSAQVITGRIPALRSQLFLFKSSEPILVGEWVRSLNRQAAAMVGGDTAVINPSTLLRLPGSIAWPKKSGRVPELTEWVTPDRHQDSWTTEALRRGFPPVADEGPAAAVPGAGTAGAVLRLVAKWVNRGWQDFEILALAHALTWPAYTVNQTKDELIKMIAGARAKGYAPDDADHPKDAPGVEDVMRVPPKPEVKPLPLLSDINIEVLPDPVWLIDRVLVQNSLVALYGPWASFKSFIALDWALSLATGLPWLGRPVMRCDVLYICAEGVGGLKNRIAAWKQHHGITGSIPGIRVIPMAVNLMDPAEAKRLILSVLAEQAASGFTPGVIICDTLARSMVGGDENSVRDTGTVINNADLIRRELGGITFLPVHHAGKDADRGMRGSTGLPGAVDTTFRVTRKDNSMSVELFCEKQKDGEDGWSVHLEAQKVTLPPRPGTLTPRQSLVLELEETTPSSSAGKSGRLKGDAALGFRVLHDTSSPRGNRSQAQTGSLPPQCAELRSWRAP